MTQYNIFDRIGQMATDVVTNGPVVMAIAGLMALVFVGSVIAAIVTRPRDRDFPAERES